MHVAFPRPCEAGPLWADTQASGHVTTPFPGFRGVCILPTSPRAGAPRAAVTFALLHGLIDLVPRRGVPIVNFPSALHLCFLHLVGATVGGHPFPFHLCCSATFSYTEKAALLFAALVGSTATFSEVLGGWVVPHLWSKTCRQHPLVGPMYSFAVAELLPLIISFASADSLLPR